MKIRWKLIKSEIEKSQESRLKEAIDRQAYQEAISKSKNELHLEIIWFEKLKDEWTIVQKEIEIKTDEIDLYILKEITINSSKRLHRRETYIYCEIY